MTPIPNSTAIALQNSIADKDMLSKDDLLSIAYNRVNIEDKQEVVNATIAIDEEVELELELELEAIENDILKLKSNEVDDDPGPEVDVLAVTIDDKDKLTKAQAEDMVSQLKLNCKHLE